jgi:hypothetical protein
MNYIIQFLVTAAVGEVRHISCHRAALVSAKATVILVWQIYCRIGASLREISSVTSIMNLKDSATLSCLEQGWAGERPVPDNTQHV